MSDEELLRLLTSETGNEVLKSLLWLQDEELDYGTEDEIVPEAKPLNSSQCKTRLETVIAMLEEKIAKDNI